MTNALSPQISRYRISRRGRKLQISDDARTILALPKEVPERTWADVLQKEENDLIIFDIREEILEDALKIGYEHYMEKQNALFTVHCAAKAWLQLINWHFYRHDPGEEPSAYPPCYIPKRVESWKPDDLPLPSPKDSWCCHKLAVGEECSGEEESLQKWPSSTSIKMPVIEEIPPEFWFPGKVAWPDEGREVIEPRALPSVDSYVSEISSEDLAAESELVQCVTDYSTEEVSKKESTFSAVRNTTPVEGSLQGAGDSSVPRERRKHDKRFSSRISVSGRSRGVLPPLDRDSRSRASVISDCRLRNLRLDTHYEISPEKVDTPPNEPFKRK